MRYLYLVLFLLLVGCSNGSSGGVSNSPNDSPPSIPPEDGTVTLTGITATRDEIDFLQYSYIRIEVNNTYSTSKIITFDFEIADPTRNNYIVYPDQTQTIPAGTSSFQITWNHNAYYYSSSGPAFKMVTYTAGVYSVSVKNNMEVGGTG